MGISILSPFFLALFVGCFLVTALLMPLVRRFAFYTDAVDHGGHRRVHEGSTPLLGGLGFALPMLAIFIAGSIAGYFCIRNWQWIFHNHREWFDMAMSLAELRSDFLLLAVGGGLILALGLLDDFRGLYARHKLAGQVFVALMFCMAGQTIDVVELPFFGVVRFDPLTSYIITSFWIVGLINAFNLIDGLDGLAGGVALITALGLAILGALHGNWLLAVTGVALAGHLLGFLLYNFHPASIFMGDTGSMFLGFVMAVICSKASFKSDIAVVSLAPLLVLGFPIFETFISMFRRYVHGKPIFGGDQHHTHHRLLGRGLSHRQAVLTLYCVTAGCMGASILNVFLPVGSRFAAIPILMYGAIFGYIGWFAGYFRPGKLQRVFLRRNHNRKFTALSHYAVLSLNSAARSVPIGDILNLTRKELGLSFLQIWDEERALVIVASGEPEMENRDPRVLDGIEKMRVQLLDGRDILLRYEYADEPKDFSKTDVTACLASIFSKCQLPTPRAPIIDMQKELSQG